MINFDDKIVKEHIGFHYLIQGLTNLIYACTDFREQKMIRALFVHTKLRVHITVTVGTNLHRLIYNLLIAIEVMLNTKGLVGSTY